MDNHGEKRLIILVDDEGMVRRSMNRFVSRLVEEQGVDIRTFECAEEVLQASSEIATYSKILLITDGNMPGKSGPMLIRELGQIHKDKRIMNVLMSGKLDEHLPAVRDLTVTCFLKPVPLDDLKEIVAEFLQR